MPFALWNRRYTGSKYKLAGWIVSLIRENCTGTSFCDIFAGTGVISARMLDGVEELHLNDLLFSNQVIYHAFFGQEAYDADKLATLASLYGGLDAAGLAPNYMSEQFGGKFFSVNDAKRIGFIRQHIEDRRGELTGREYALLLASLLYAADKAANTVGHYDAFIKKGPVPDRFDFDLVRPLDTAGKRICITREDANALSRRLQSDIVYIDPPYNSRQYSRFYHVLENLAQWKKPALFGEALKPEPENMSEYCRSTAPAAFDDLVTHLDCRYMVVSYNNTYRSKSSSSRNKIELEQLLASLRKRGEVAVYEKPHPYFNAGKTAFADHKEYIFICEVKN